MDMLYHMYLAFARAYQHVINSIAYLAIGSSNDQKGEEPPPRAMIERLHSKSPQAIESAASTSEAMPLLVDVVLNILCFCDVATVLSVSQVGLQL
jgi:hypothetical protein